MAMNIFLGGVGGQGIGLLSEVILRAADHAEMTVKGVDTHGLAQRGGIVVSRIRIGNDVFSPLIPKGEADLAVALERHEALRCMNTALKDGGVLVYYDVSWQPLEVRLKKANPVASEFIASECGKRNITEYRVYKKELTDARMQNIVLLACICKNGLIPGVLKTHFKEAMEDLLDGEVLRRNMDLFEEECSDV